MADDLVAALRQFFQRVRVNLGHAAVGIDGALDAVMGEDIHDAPDAGFAAIFAVRDRGVIGFAALAAPVLRIFVKSFERNKKTNGDFGVVRPFQWCESHSSILNCAPAPTGSAQLVRALKTLPEYH